LQQKEVAEEMQVRLPRGEHALERDEDGEGRGLEDGGYG
jgi:hypothetical protein